jgi:hypothetical protein
VSRLPKRPKAKHKPDNGKYTQEERERWLYKTADEMREINDLVEKRLAQKGIPLKLPQGDEQGPASGRVSIINRFFSE